MSVTPLRVLLISAGVGLLQIILSVAAGVHSDVVVQYNLHRFGYLRSFHWSLTYVLVMPVILAASVPATLALYKSKILSVHRVGFYFLLAFAAFFAAANAGFEGWHVWAQTPEKLKYLQWNSFNPVDSTFTYPNSFARILHVALFWIGYGHYFAGCFFGAIVGVGVPWYFALVSRENRPEIQLRNFEVGLLSSQKTAVVGYLLFLAILRSSKTSMHLESLGVSVEVEKIGEFVTNAKPYLDLIFDGLVQDLALGIIWIAVAVFAHTLAWRISAHPKSTGFVQDLFHPVAGAYELLGSSTRFWVGVSIVGIVLPPPGFVYLVAVCAVIAGLHLIKSSHGT